MKRNSPTPKITDMDTHLKILAKLTLIMCIMIPAAASDASDEWFLASRDGQCAKIKVLERKIPDLSGVDSPATFVNLMHDRGYEVTVKEISKLSDKAVQVEVPEKGLALMFVRKKLCKDFVQK